MVTARKTASTRKSTLLRREEIADVALRILALEGHRRFTSKYLAEQVGITEGAIFRHFHSMEAIADAIVERIGLALLPSLEVQHTDPIEQLHRFFQHRASILSAKPELFHLLLTDQLEQAAGPLHAEQVNGFRRRTQRFVLECLTRAKTNGILAEDVTVESALRLVMGAIMALSHGDQASANSAMRDPSIEDLWQLIERTLRGRKPRK
jgi:AcrR family transcriptional regulator